MMFFYTFYVAYLFAATTPKTVEGKRLNEVFTSKLNNNNNKVHQITEIEVLANDDQTPRRQLQSNLMKKAGDMCYGLNGAAQSIMAGRLEAGTAGNEACTTLPTTQGAWEYLSIAPLKVGLAKAGNTYIGTSTGNVLLIVKATEDNAPTSTRAPLLEVTPTLASVENGKAFVGNVGALFGSYYGYNAAGTPLKRTDVGATAAAGPFGFLGFQAGIAVEELSYSTSTFQATVINPVNANNREKTMNACVLPLSGTTCPAAKTAKEGTLKYSFYGYFGGNKWTDAIANSGAAYTQLVARNTFDVTQMASATEQDKIKICYDAEDDEDATKCQKISEVPTAGKAFTKNLFVRGASDADESGVNVEFSKNVNYGQIKKAAGAAGAMNGEELSSMETFDAANSALSESSPSGVTFALHRDTANKLYIDIQVPIAGKPLANNGGYFIYDPTVSGAAEKSVVTALFMSFMVSLWAMM